MLKIALKCAKNRKFWPIFRGSRTKMKLANFIFFPENTNFQYGFKTYFDLIKIGFVVKKLQFFEFFWKNKKNYTDFLKNRKFWFFSIFSQKMKFYAFNLLKLVEKQFYVLKNTQNCYKIAYGYIFKICTAHIYMPKIAIFCFKIHKFCIFLEGLWGKMKLANFNLFFWNIIFQ